MGADSLKIGLCCALPLRVLESYRGVYCNIWHGNALIVPEPPDAPVSFIVYSGQIDEWRRWLKDSSISTRPKGSASAELWSLLAYWRPMDQTSLAAFFEEISTAKAQMRQFLEDHDVTITDDWEAHLYIGMPPQFTAYEGY